MKFLTVCVLLLLSCVVQAKPFKVGDVPFDLIGNNIDGAEVKVSDYKGKVVIVSFWASWCGPCRKELPVMSAIQKSATTERIQVISVNLDEDIKVFKKLSEVLSGTQMKLVSDAHQKTKRKYGVEGIPHMVIVNAEGVVAAVHIGYSESELPDLIKEINEIARMKPAS